MEYSDKPEMVRKFDSDRIEPDNCDLLDAEGDSIEEWLNTHVIDEWQDCPFLEGWGVFPNAGTGECFKSILVRVDGRAALTAQNRAAWITSIFDHIIEYLKHCPGTQRIMFYVVPPADEIPNFLKSWRHSWISFRDTLGMPLQHNAGGAPALRVSVRKRPWLCFFHSNGRPAGGQQLFAWWRNASSAERGSLREAVRLVAYVDVDSARNCKFVGGYTGQPANLNGINLLTFGDLAGQANEIRNWRMRIYLNVASSILPIGVSGMVRRVTATQMQHGGAALKPTTAWAADNMEDFYRNPCRYLVCPVP